MGMTRLITTSKCRVRAPERLRLALAASFLSRGWTAVLSLLAVPLYLRFLGVEAYGVVGIFVSLSAVVGLLDLGLGATLTREMAKLPGGQAQPPQARDIARTFELVYVGLALLVGGLGALLAYPLAMFWVTVDTLNRGDVAQALLLGSVALACQWPGNLYGAGLAGLQKQVLFGGVTTVLGTVRVALTLVVIRLAPSLETFFWAQIVAAVVQSSLLWCLFWRALGSDGRAPVFRLEALRDSLGFAGGMAGIALTTIVLTQADKLVLSRALSLSEFGVYVVASALATGLYIVITPLFSVMYPRFSALVHWGAEKEGELARQYHAASQLIAFLLVPLAVLLGVYGQEVLTLWTGNQALGTAGGWTLSLLVMGNACNGLMNMPYALQLAYGWTRLTLWFSVVSIVLLVPCVWWAAVKYGPVGGAAVWALLNLGYLVVAPQILHQRLLRSEKLTWYKAGVFLPAAVCLILAMLAKQIPLTDLSRGSVALVLLAYWIAMTVSLVVLMQQPRRAALALWSARNRFGK